MLSYEFLRAFATPYRLNEMENFSIFHEYQSTVIASFDVRIHTMVYFWPHSQQFFQGGFIATVILKPLAYILKSKYDTLENIFQRRPDT